MSFEKGSRVRLLPAFAEQGEENEVFIVLEDRGDRVLVYAQADANLPIVPQEVIESRMLAPCA